MFDPGLMRAALSSQLFEMSQINGKRRAPSPHFSIPSLISSFLGALARIPYQHVVRSNEAEAGHPQISQIAQIQPVSIDGLTIRAPENLRNLRNLRFSLPVFLLLRRGHSSQAMPCDEPRF